MKLTPWSNISMIFKICMPEPGRQPKSTKNPIQDPHVNCVRGFKPHQQETGEHENQPFQIWPPVRAPSCGSHVPVDMIPTALHQCAGSQNYQPLSATMRENQHMTMSRARVLASVHMPKPRQTQKASSISSPLRPELVVSQNKLLRVQGHHPAVRTTFSAE